VGVVKIAPQDERCQAWFMPANGYYAVQCSKRATTERAGKRCCGTHARQADRWGDRMQSMVDYWWRAA
jgi:hypothetical protein